MSHGRSQAPLELRRITDDLLGKARVGGSWRIVAIGWATVDLDRAAAEFGTRWPDLATMKDAPADGLLGARARLAHGKVLPSGPDSIALVLLEPSTEGRLAASLARHGEGPAAVWLAPAGATDGADGRRTSVPADGPFGPQRLVLGGPIAGPHVLLLERSPGTIGR